MLKIDKLKFSYNNTDILKEIDLFLEEREFIGIIGPNGSGKTTLLKNISRVLSPDSGYIYLNERVLNEYSPLELARFMAVVPQDTTVNYNFSVYDLIMMGRNPYQDRWGRINQEDREITNEVMELTDTFKFRDKRIDQLSGGERQRVIIARALAQKPRVILLDEPTASLDINYQGEIFDLLAALNKDLDLTVIVVSHDLNLSSQYCSKLVLLKDGEVFKTGTPGEVLTEENIKSVYNTDVVIRNNPLTDRPYIILVPRKDKPELSPVKNTRIHVICGGGSGKEVLQQLYRAGYQLSCGVINQGDSDWEMARSLNLEVVEIPPFTAINEKSLDHNKRLMVEADVVIITDTPFGYGNLANLSQVAELGDKRVILENRRGIEERDFTGGKACEYWSEILKEEETYLADDRLEVFALLTEFQLQS